MSRRRRTVLIILATCSFLVCLRVWSLWFFWGLKGGEFHTAEEVWSTFDQLSSDGLITSPDEAARNKAKWELKSASQRATSRGFDDGAPALIALALAASTLACAVWPSRFTPSPKPPRAR